MKLFLISTVCICESRVRYGKRFRYKIISGRKFIYNDDFILYLKEEDKEKPYFALKVDNTDVLVAGENN